MYLPWRGSLLKKYKNKFVQFNNLFEIFNLFFNVFFVTQKSTALNHHAGGLEHGVGDLGDGELLMVGLLGGDDRSVRGKHEMDTGVGHQVGLELRDINVQRT